MIKGFFLFLFRFIRAFFLGILLLAFLGAGMVFGSFYLLDYMIQGKEVVVPNIIGMSETQAIRTLIENDLTLDRDIERPHDEETPPGIVIDQQPYPGSMVKAGRPIRLTISAGPRRMVIPDVVGQEASNLMAIIRGTGLEIGQRAQASHAEMPEGVIIAQDPPSGEQIVEAKQINVLISSGPPITTYVMPNYIGMPKEEVIQDIVRLQPLLLPQENLITEPVTDPQLWGKVLQQRPEPGAQIRDGDPVQLWVGEASAPLGEGRMEHVTFENLGGLPLSDLAIIIWDDRAQLTQQPVVQPVEIEPQATEYSEWILLYGDALVELGWIRDRSPVLRYEQLSQALYTAN